MFLRNLTKNPSVDNPYFAVPTRTERLNITRMR